jgi:anaerobic ribonucleoside-triphosphate reductase
MKCTTCGFDEFFAARDGVVCRRCGALRQPLSLKKRVGGAGAAIRPPHRNEEGFSLLS